jgi:hypothetical protein
VHLVLPLTVGIRDGAVHLVLTRQRVRTCTSQLQNSSTPEAYMLDFSMYQSGIDFKFPYSSRKLKPLTP